MVIHELEEMVRFNGANYRRLQQIHEVKKIHMDDFLYLYDEYNYTPLIMEGERIENFPNRKY